MTGTWVGTYCYGEVKYLRRRQLILTMQIAYNHSRNQDMSYWFYAPCLHTLVSIEKGCRLEIRDCIIQYLHARDHEPAAWDTI